MDICTYNVNGETFMLSEIKNEVLVNYQVEVVNNNHSLFLLPIKEIKSDDVIKIEVNITDMQSIDDYIEKDLLTMENYLNCIMKICDTYLKCEDYMLKPGNIVLDNRTIFLDKNNNEIYMLYLPIENNDLYDESIKLKNYLIKFGEEISNTIINNENINEVIKYLSSTDVTALNIKKYVENLINKQNADNIIIAGKETKEEVTVVKKDTIFEKMKRRLKGNDKKKLDELNCSNLVSKNAFLICENNNIIERIELDKEVFLFGRIVGGVDYVITSSTASRVHARIENLSSEYYITDLDSKNGTYLNGIKLIANQRYKLENNNVIKIANNMFKFNLV